MKRSGIVAVLLITFGLSACGGDDSKSATNKNLDDALSEYSKSSDEAKEAVDEAQKTASSIAAKYGAGATGTGSEVTFAKFDGKVRFANFYAKGGKGVDVDVYFGNSAETGKKLGTFKYGTISEATDMYLMEDPYVTSSEGGSKLRLIAMPKGKKSLEDMVMSETRSVEAGDDYLFALGWDNISTSSGALFKVSNLASIDTPPSGKGMIVLNDIGATGAQGSSFSSLNIGDACDSARSAQGFTTGNLGTAYEVEPGPYQVFSFDANTECEHSSEKQSIEVAAGDVWALFTWGASSDSISSTALKVK